MFAFLTAVPTTTQWQSWLLFRHSQSFGVADPQFHADIGFYVFELPFLSFVLDWLFFAMIIVLLLVVMTHVLNGGVMFASPIPTISQAARGHVAVLLAVLAALKAADYWIRRYETTNERRGFVQGATYAVVNALHPALLLLAFVAIVTAGLYLASLRTGSWRLPLVASAVWVVLAIAAGYIYPAAVQGLVVNANQRAREAEYIQRNIEATRQAMGITDEHVTPQTVAFEALVGGRASPATSFHCRTSACSNPTEMRDRFRLDVEDSQAGLTINDLDVDRYPVDESRRTDAHRGARAQPRHDREPRLAEPASDQHARLRTRDGAGESRRAEWTARLRDGSARSTGVVLQSDARGLRDRRDDRDRSGPAAMAARTRAKRECEMSSFAPPRRIRAGVPRLQHRRLRCDR